MKLHQPINNSPKRNNIHYEIKGVEEDIGKTTFGAIYPDAQFAPTAVNNRLNFFDYSFCIFFAWCSDAYANGGHQKGWKGGVDYERQPAQFL